MRASCALCNAPGPLRRYQYQSVEPVPVNHVRTWEDATINTLLEQANRMLGDQLK